MVNRIAGALVIVVGLGFGALSLIQIRTGRYRGLRRLRGSPTLEQVRAGGWVGMAIALPPILVGASWLVDGDAGEFLIVGGYLVITMGGVWALQHRLRRGQAVRRGR